MANLLQILSMVEEAAGTRMYEVKRQTTQKLIEKKDSKLAEFQAVRKTSGLTKLVLIVPKSSGDKRRAFP